MEPFITPETRDVLGPHYNVVRIFNATSTTFVVKNDSCPELIYKPDFDRFLDILGLKPLDISSDFEKDEIASKTTCLPMFHFNSGKKSENTLRWLTLLDENKNNEIKTVLIVDAETVLHFPEYKSCFLLPMLCKEQNEKRGGSVFVKGFSTF